MVHHSGLSSTNIKVLKSSLKLSSRSNSVTSSSSSNKNVRFAPELTTVKNFCSNDKPSSISNENSPDLIPLDDYNNFNQNDKYNRINIDDIDTNDLWFNQSLFNTSNKKFKSNFQLDYDSDSGLDDDDSENENSNNFLLDFGKRNNFNFRNPFSNGNNSIIINNNNNNNKFSIPNSITQNNNINVVNSSSNIDTFVISEWGFVNSNVNNFKQSTDNLENDINRFLNNQNIKLHSLKQVLDENNKKTDKIEGLIFVNNLNFEKFIEIKFSFTNWSDIHYVTAKFNRSMTGKIDEFKFVINLKSLNYFLKCKNLIFANTFNEVTICPLTIELCCRYDVNNETYYDNNNYRNYELNLLVSTNGFIDNSMVNIKDQQEAGRASTTSTIVNNNKPKASFYSDFLVSTTLSHKIHLNGKSPLTVGTSRRFSEDTDYYNTSPLKHLYHNDTSLIKPTRLNEVLTSSNVDNNKIDNNSIDDSFQMDSLSLSPSDEPESYFALTAYTTPSLSSSLSSSLSDLSPLQEFNDTLINSNNKDQFYYKQFSLGNNNDDDNHSNEPIGTNKFLDSRDDDCGDIVGNDFYSDGHNFSPFTISNSNDFFDDRQSIITDTPPIFYSNRNSTTTNPIMNNNINVNNNSNETLVNTNHQSNSDNVNFNELHPDQLRENHSLRTSSNGSKSSSSTSTSPETRDDSSSIRIESTLTNSSVANFNGSIKPRDMDYQTLLNSYCFFTPDDNNINDRSNSGKGYNPIEAFVKKQPPNSASEISS